MAKLCAYLFVEHIGRTRGAVVISSPISGVYDVADDGVSHRRRHVI